MHQEACDGGRFVPQELALPPSSGSALDVRLILVQKYIFYIANVLIRDNIRRHENPRIPS